MKRKKRIRREIKTLDLHNHTHSEAPRLIFNFSCKTTFGIITICKQTMAV
jgi:hypothetical protein